MTWRQDIKYKMKVWFLQLNETVFASFGTWIAVARDTKRRLYEISSKHQYLLLILLYEDNSYNENATLPQ